MRNYTNEEILSICDHTCLKQTMKMDDLHELCRDALKYKTASVCIPPSYIKDAKKFYPDVKVCTVVGFPNGNCTTNTKAFETQEALENGADEIDMVINIGRLKDKDYDYVKNEIETLKKICGDKVLKVIIETCLLTDEEKIKMCEIITETNADYIKTSTGFSTGGATIEDIDIFAKNVGPKVKIKASGGISSLEDAEEFITHGADRLGTSRIVKTIKESE